MGGGKNLIQQGFRAAQVLFLFLFYKKMERVMAIPRPNFLSK